MTTKTLMKEDRTYFEALLRKLHARLSEDLEELEDEALDRGDRRGVGLGDAASDEWAEELNLALLTLDDVHVREVVSALQRLREGTFGTCASCGARIGRARLKQVPWTCACLDCQKQEEERSPLPE